MKIYFSGIFPWASGKKSSGRQEMCWLTTEINCEIFRNDSSGVLILSSLQLAILEVFAPGKLSNSANLRTYFS